VKYIKSHRRRTKDGGISAPEGVQKNLSEKLGRKAPKGPVGTHEGLSGRKKKRGAKGEKSIASQGRVAPRRGEEDGKHGGGTWIMCFKRKDYFPRVNKK